MSGLDDLIKGVAGGQGGGLGGILGGLVGTGESGGLGDVLGGLGSAGGVNTGADGASSTPRSAPSSTSETEAGRQAEACRWARW